MAADPALRALRAAVKGLTYESESDEPFEAFVWPAGEAGGALSAKKVLALGGHDPGEAVEQQTADKFFAPLVTDQDWHGDEEKAVVGQYRKLRETVDGLLTAPKVYRVGGGPEKTVYLVGKTAAGDWAGVKTTAVET